MEQERVNLGAGVKSLLENAVSLRDETGGSALASDHGAQVLSWTPSGEHRSRLFLSGRTQAGAGASIRGGVPVVFPQFAARGPLPKHGFARTRAWRRRQLTAAGAEFELSDDERTRQVWPHAFILRLSVSLQGDGLEIRLAAENCGDAPFQFTAALHSYLAVDEVRDTRLFGLDGAEYFDAVDGWTLKRQRGESPVFGDELDRVYRGAPSRLQLEDGPRRTVIESEGFADVVVWNPGPAKAAALSDLEAGGGARFLCVEAAQVETALRLPPAERWVGVQRLRRV